MVNPKRRRLRSKGIKYEDVPDLEADNCLTSFPSVGMGHPKWKIEFPGGVIPSIGVPQSQIMDSGIHTHIHNLTCVHTYSRSGNF